MPCVGEATDHDIESVVVGMGDVGEETGGIGEVLEVDDFKEKEIGFAYGVDEHLGMYLLQLFGRQAFSQERQKRFSQSLVFQLLHDCMNCEETLFLSIVRRCDLS